MLSLGAKLPLCLFVSAALIHASGAAWADAPGEDPDLPPPPVLVTPTPIYPAPLSQTTQTTYVPQSVALSGPEEITDVIEGRSPAGYTPVQRKRLGLLIGGGVTLGVAYGYSALAAAIGEDLSRTSNGGTNGAAPLFIPVLGPFLTLGNTDSATAKFFLVGLGAAQVTGAIMLYYGLTTTKTVYVRNDLLGSATITPMVGDHTTGMALSGRF